MKETRKTWKMAAVALAAALLFLGGVSGCAPKEEELPSSSQVRDPDLFPEGTSIGGKNISGKTVGEALTIAQGALEEAKNAMQITVKFRDDTVVLSKGDFVTKDLLELTLPKLLEKDKGEKYELSYVMDLSEAGKQKLKDAAKGCFVEGKDASIASYDSSAEAFVFSDEQKGSRVDMVKTLKSVRQLLSQKHGGDIQAAFVETNPKVTKEHLKKNFQLLSSYTTESTNTSNGNSNMALALSHVNGTILEPGQEFSYNATIGDSTDPGNGWLPAGGLAGGISVQMYGGGICQGSTTIYNAALLAGMEIVERDCHSSPSSYCPIGLDATVDYGNIDFRFRNPLDSAVYISSWMSDTTLHVKFYGCLPKEWDKIEVSSEETGSEPPLSTVSFVVDGQLSKGEYERRSSGQTGYYAKAYRTYYKGDAVVKTEELPSSYYAATGTVYAVGEGTDTSKVDTGSSSGTISSSPSPSPTPSATPTPTVTPPPQETDPPEPIETDPPEPIETDPPEPIETDPPEPIETDPPEPVETDLPAEGE